MADQIQEITELEQAFFQIEKIKAQVNALSDFLAAKLTAQHAHKPKNAGMIDPRTGRRFREKK